MKKLYFAGILLFLGLCGQLRAQQEGQPSNSGKEKGAAVVKGHLSESDAAKLQSMAKEIGESLAEGNVEPTLKYTHPRVAGLVGGPEAFKQNTEKTVDVLADNKVRLLSSSYLIEDRNVYEVGEDLVVIVRQRSVAEIYGEEVEIEGFLLAIKEKVEVKKEGGAEESIDISVDGGEKGYFFVEGSAFEDREIGVLMLPGLKEVALALPRLSVRDHERGN